MENGKNNMTLKEHLNNAKAASLKVPRAKFGEVEMFRSMLAWFKKQPNCSVAELHKKTISNEDAPNNPICEISDLLTICYSSKYRCAKIQFLQAKYMRDDVNIRGDVDMFRFYADSRQYRLLKDCPNISPRLSSLPSDILSNSCSPSITSYGVFYQDDQNQLNCAYEITQLIKPADPLQMNYERRSKLCYFDTKKDAYGFLRWNKHRCFYHPCCFPCMDCDLCCLRQELISTLDVDTYADRLLKFQVGSPICGHRLADFASNLKELYNREEKKGKFTKRFNDFFNQFDGGDIELENRRYDFNPIEPCAILLINFDGEQENKRSTNYEI